MTIDDQEDSGQESALQKYLKRQKSEGGGVPEDIDSAVVVEPPPLPELPTVIEVAASDLNIPEGGESEVRATIQFRPAGFWRRALALFIDASLLMLIVSPLTYTLPFFATPDLTLLKGGEFAVFFRALSLYMAMNIAVTLVARFFYYGWFYKNKGATPGKLALNMRVFNVDTGTYPNYGQTFLREGIMKPYVSGLITLGIGYLIVGFRRDKKGLHDLVCSTQVVVQE